MKKITLMIALVLASCTFSMAQSIAYVDTDAVLQKMQSYQQAQEQINKIVENWNQEIQQKYKNIDDAYRAFQAEQVLLSESERAQREEEIVKMEKETREFQKQKFGNNGDLSKRRKDLVQPIQDEVYAAIEELANRKKYDFVLDKSSGVAILFANPKYDITEDVMREVGAK